MSLINIRPQELRLTALQLILKARSVNQAINAIDHEINSLGEDVFSGNSAVRFRVDYQKYRSHLLSSSILITHFARSLIDIVNDFEKVDRKLAFALPLTIYPVVGALTGLFRKILPNWGAGNMKQFPWVEGLDTSTGSSDEINEGVRSRDADSTQNGQDNASTGITHYQTGDYLTANLDTNPIPIKGRGTWKGYCASYVSNVVPEIDGVKHATDFISKYNLSPFSSNGDLRTQLEPGDVIVWDAGQKGSDVTSGHAAVILEVHQDHVVLAESAWGGGKYDPKFSDNQYVGRMLDTTEVSGLYVWSNPKVNENQLDILHG